MEVHFYEKNGAIWSWGKLNSFLNQWKDVDSTNTNYIYVYIHKIKVIVQPHTGGRRYWKICWWFQTQFYLKTRSSTLLQQLMTPICVYKYTIWFTYHGVISKVLCGERETDSIYVIKRVTVINMWHSSSLFIHPYTLRNNWEWIATVSGIVVWFLLSILFKVAVWI